MIILLGRVMTFTYVRTSRALLNIDLERYTSMLDRGFLDVYETKILVCGALNVCVCVCVYY